MDGPWLDETDAANRARRSPSTMQKLRHRGTGPRYSKQGGLVVYHVDWIDEWLASAAVSSTSEQRQAA